jgi:hypothetical protein
VGVLEVIESWCWFWGARYWGGSTGLLVTLLNFYLWILESISCFYRGRPTCGDVAHLVSVAWRVLERKRKICLIRPVRTISNLKKIPKQNSIFLKDTKNIDNKKFKTPKTIITVAQNSKKTDPLKNHSFVFQSRTTTKRVGFSTFLSFLWFSIQYFFSFWVGLWSAYKMRISWKFELEIIWWFYMLDKDFVWIFAFKDTRDFWMFWGGSRITRSFFGVKWRRLTVCQCLSLTLI